MNGRRDIVLTFIIVALGLLTSAPAGAVVELTLDAGYRLVSNKAAISSDGLRMVGLELKPASLERFTADCAALPPLKDAPEAKIARTMGPKKLGKSGVLCGMVLHRREHDHTLVVSVAMPRRGPDATARPDERVELSILYDGEPDAWTRKVLLRDVRALVAGVHDEGGDELAMRVPSPQQRLPDLPLACDQGTALPRGWRAVPNGFGDPPARTVLEEVGGHRRTLRMEVLSQTLPAFTMKKMAGAPPDARWWETPNHQIHTAYVAAGKKTHVIFDALPCGKVLMLVVFGKAGKRARRWSGEGVSRMLTAHIRAGGEAEIARLFPDKASTPYGGTTAKEKRAAKRWVARLSGPRGKSIGSDGADRSTGQASDGYAVGASRSMLRFCPDGTFKAQSRSELFVSTPYGGGSSGSTERLYGRWGVFGLGGGPELFLWTQGSTQRMRLPEKLQLIMLAGGAFKLSDLRPGGCGASGG